MSVAVCAVPALPHLDPLLDGVRQWLAAEHIPHHNLPDVQALLSNPRLMAQVQVVNKHSLQLLDIKQVNYHRIIILLQLVFKQVK